jgi:mannose-6-phosphate isomerase-like protein (cupin superfamily)
LNRQAARVATSLIGSLALALVLGGAAQGQVKDEPQYVSSKDLSALVAKPKDGLVSIAVPTGPDYTVLVAHRDKTGEVEIHTKFDDEFVVRAGRASVLIGAKVEGAKETAPNELRGGTVVDGKTYDLAPGDVIWIPAGLGHQVIVPNGGSFEYLAIKFPANRTP